MSPVDLNVSPSQLANAGIRVPTQNTCNLTCSVVPPTNALQLDVFLFLKQFVNLEILLETQV
jgi:hypothetical protein